MIRQRVTAGLKRAVEAGKTLGRPRVSPAIEKRIQAQLRAGKGINSTAREVGVGTGTVQRIKQEMKGPWPREAEGAQKKLKRVPPDVRFTQ
jgi:DNA invertase Pin-like site-specific DNA recombinase